MVAGHERRSECYNMIADWGFRGRDVKDQRLITMIAQDIDWDSFEEFVDTYNWCMDKFFDSPCEDDLYN